MPARIKICGITRPRDAEYAAQAGANAIGIVFYSKSSRYVADLGLAREIAQAATPLVNVVALFVNAEDSLVENVIQTVPINLLQFHGDETPEQCKAFGVAFIKAVRMKPGQDPVELADFYSEARGVLLDTYVSGQPGGTGKSFDWDLFPRSKRHRFVLAGGLRPDNVAQAIKRTQCLAVDVSGGVEASPGIKDENLVSAFIQAVNKVE